jgi:hypothetical protein
MRVFISYGNPEDQVTALRLQALGVVNGLSIYVPPAFTRRQPGSTNAPEVADQLSKADVVLGLIGWGFSEACQVELDAAAGAGKNLIVMSNPALGIQLNESLAVSHVPIHPGNLVETERLILQRLNQMRMAKDESTALIGLGTIALGLLVLANAD